MEGTHILTNLNMMKETILEKETVTDTQYLVKEYDSKANRYVVVATYSDKENAVRYANMVKSNHDVFVVVRRTVVKETINDTVQEVIHP